MANKEQGGFSIGVYDDHIIDDNVRDKYGPSGDAEDRRNALRLGLVDRDGELTRKGTDVLTQDIAQLERNALAWLKKSFVGARDEGHDNYGDLVGTFWFNPQSVRQAELIDTGIRERIDMTDASYGDLANDVWLRVSRFGSSVLGGAINFFDVDEDAIEETLDRARAASRDRQRSRARSTRRRR